MENPMLSDPSPEKLTERARARFMSIKIACSAGIILSAWYAGCMNSTGAIFLTSVVFLGCLYDVSGRVFIKTDLWEPRPPKPDLSAGSEPTGSTRLCSNGWPQYRAVCLFAILSVLILAVSQHKIPGFFNVCLLSNMQFSVQSIPYTLWLNWDKALLAVILWIVCTPWPIHRYVQWFAQWCIKSYGQIKPPSDAENNRSIMAESDPKPLTVPDAAAITPAWPVYDGSKKSPFLGLHLQKSVQTWARTMVQT